MAAGAALVSVVRVTNGAEVGDIAVWRFCFAVSAATTLAVDVAERLILRWWGSVSGSGDVYTIRGG